MRTGQLLVAASFVLLTAAACGGVSGSANASSGSVLTTGATPTAPPKSIAGTVPPATTAPPVARTTPPAAGGSHTVPPGQITESGTGAAPQGVQVTGDGRTVVFDAEQSGCQLITAQATTQTATQVTIQVITTNTSKGNQMCPMIVRVVQVSATLNAPLDNRTIVFQSVVKHS